MACEDIEKRLADLKAQKKDQKLAMQFAQGPGLQAMQEQLARIEAQIAVEEKALADCKVLSVPHPAAPFIGRVKELHCATASKELGKDEPYLLIASVDMLGQVAVGPLGVPKPEVHCFKVGPWSDISTGSTRAAGVLAAGNRPAFWDLDSKRRIVANPTDVVFLVAMMEHDGASPDAIRGAVQTNLNGSIAQNLGRNYATMVDSLKSAMTAAIDIARGAGVSPSGLNFDDRIGAVHQLELTTTALDHVNGLGTFEKSLTFKTFKSSGKVNNEYTITFIFEQ